MNIVESKKLLALKQEMRKNILQGRKSLPYKGGNKVGLIEKKVHRSQKR